MGAHTEQFIRNIQNILADKVMTAREIQIELKNEVMATGLRRKLLPTHQQIVGLLRNPKNFKLVEVIEETRHRRTLKYSNVIMEEE